MTAALGHGVAADVVVLGRQGQAAEVVDGENRGWIRCLAGEERPVGGDVRHGGSAQVEHRPPRWGSEVAAETLGRSGGDCHADADLQGTRA